MCDMVQEEPQRWGLPARDRVVDGCDAEDVGRRIGRLGKAGIGREHPRERAEIADECRGEGAQRRHEEHPLERQPADADRKAEGTVRAGAALQQHPNDPGAASQGG